MRDRQAIAQDELPWGCGIRFEGQTPRLERDRGQVEGVLRRTGGGLNSRIGQDVRICTDGGIMAEITAGKPEWEEIRKGRLLHA